MNSWTQWMQKRTVILFLLVLGNFQGCATSTPTENKDQFIKDLISTSQPSATQVKPSPSPLSLDKEIDSENDSDDPNSSSATDDQAASQLFDITPLESNPYIKKWIQYFSEKDHARFQLFLDRGSEYKDVVENLLQENNLPPQLYYLAMIESGYSTKATSIAKAAGVWQFIPGTAKRYGLEVNSFTDERRDPIRATEAAARYLRDLYNVFGSWHLALAAYNAGEYRILGAVLRGKSRDFWSLIQAGTLPSETADYVPKFIAAMMIGENPSAYGFRDPQIKVKYPDLKTIEVPTPLHLKDIAAVFQIPLSELERYNPNIRKHITPPQYKTYEIWIPEQKLSESNNLLPLLSQYQLKHRNFQEKSQALVSSEEDGNRHYYVVKPNDTLKKIAKKYRVSVRYLKKINHLKSSQLAAGTSIRIHSNQYQAQTLIRYRVRKGDQLSLIAKKFGISIQDILSINVLNKNKLNVGQVLRIRTNPKVG